jgi:glycosyltransferase involved in cell wall biosynthesis
VFGTYDVHGDPRMRILSEGFRQHDCDVVECHHPLGIDDAARIDLLQRPWTASFLVGRVARRWRALAHDVRAAPPPDAVLVGYPGHADILYARRLFKGVPIILDHLEFATAAARDHGANGRTSQALLGALDRAAVRRANVIVVDSEGQRDRLPVTDRDRAVVSVVSEADEWVDVARPPAEVSAALLKVVFFGEFTPGDGSAVIGRALAELAGEDIDVTMIGNGPEHPEARMSARGNDRVTWVDRVQPADLPKLVADHDVCLGEFGMGGLGPDGPPPKLFHAAAAGCAVVTAGPVAQPMFGTAFCQVPPCDSAALASVLRRLSLDTGRLVRMRELAGNLARERYAPDQIVRPIVDRVRSL